MVRLYGFRDLHHLPKQLRFLLVSTRRIHNNYIETFLLELGNTLRRNSNGVRLGVGTEVCNFRLGCRLTGLVERTSTEGIGTNDT